jgi:pimeloyl-ACP methyl ester carboxylesterase
MTRLCKRLKTATLGATVLTMGLALASAAFAAGDSWKTLPELAPWPKAAKSGYAPVNGIRMYYAVFGQGSPVLLLHGGLANSRYWGGVIPVLIRNHFKVVVTDSRGHGRSTRTGEPYSYDLLTSDVLALMDFLRLQQADVIGWSDGGIIGLDLAINHPERLRRLFVYAANSTPAGVRQDVGDNPTFAAYLERTRAEYRKLSATPDEYASFLLQIQTMWAQQPNFSEQQLRRITARTAVVDGAHDEAIKPEHTAYLAQTIPHATLIVFPDVSHFGMLQNPLEFGSAAGKFLTEH